MSGQNHQIGQSNPPAWNHHLQSYIPQLPMAHMSNNTANERPLAPWHVAGANNQPGSGTLNPITEREMYPYLPKPPMDINPMIAPSAYARHSIDSAPFSGTMDLSVSNASRFIDLPLAPTTNTMATRSVHSSVNNSDVNSLTPHSSPSSNNRLTRNSISPSVIHPNPARISSERPFNGDGYHPNCNPVPVEVPIMYPPSHLVVNESISNAGMTSRENTTISPSQNVAGKSIDLSILNTVKQTHSTENTVDGMYDVDPFNADTISDLTASPKKRRSRKPNKTSRIANEYKSGTDESLNGTETPVKAEMDKQHVPSVNRNDESVDSGVDKKCVNRSPVIKSSQEDHEKSAMKRPPSKNVSDDEAINKKRRSRRSRDQCDADVDDVNDIFGTSASEPAKKTYQCENETIASSRTAEMDAETSFEEVENKLTEMFAGIDDNNETTTGTSKENPETNNNTSPAKNIEENGLNTDDENKDFVLMARTKKRKVASRKPVSKSNKTGKCGVKKSKGKGRFEDDTLPINLNNSKAGRQIKEKEQEDRYRGPMVQVRNSAGTVTVLNGPLLAEDDTDRQTGIKGKKFHSNHVAERNKMRTIQAGAKYDPDGQDVSWMCAFCKLGPHKMGLGDLFGPYIVTTTCDEFKMTRINLTDDEFKSNRTKMTMVQRAPHCMPIVPASAAENGFKSPEHQKSGGKRGPKKKDKPNELTSIADETIFYGMTKVSETSYEIWLHEDCIIWAPGIHMIAGRLIGLEETLWSSTRSKCTLCTNNGATVCCLQRGCGILIHVACGRQSNWRLCDADLKSYCRKHGPVDSSISISSDNDNGNNSHIIVSSLQTSSRTDAPSESNIICT